MQTEFMLLAIYNKPRLSLDETCHALGMSTATGYTHRSLGKFPVVCRAARLQPTSATLRRLWTNCVSKPGSALRRNKTSGSATEKLRRGALKPSWIVTCRSSPSSVRPRGRGSANRPAVLTGGPRLAFQIIDFC